MKGRMRQDNIRGYKWKRGGENETNEGRKYVIDESAVTRRNTTKGRKTVPCKKREGGREEKREGGKKTVKVK